MALNNRYDFMMLFEIPMETRMQETLREWMRNPVTAISPMCA